MKKKNLIHSLLMMTVSIVITSCTAGAGDRRDRNLEQAALARLDSVDGVRYVGMSDVHELDDDRLQAVVIYYVTDSAGDRTERNARVTASHDCSEILAWEDLDSQVFGDVRQMVDDKLEEKGIDMDGSLLEALIELKRR